MEVAPPVDSEDVPTKGPSFMDSLNAVASGFRGGAAPTERPLRGAEKTANTVVSDILELVDSAIRSRLGETFGIAPSERLLVTNGASRYLPPAFLNPLARALGPIAITVGLGLWIWRDYDQMVAARRQYQNAVTQNSGQTIYQAAPPAPSPVAAQPVVEGNIAPEQSIAGAIFPANDDWRMGTERS